MEGVLWRRCGIPVFAFLISACSGGGGSTQARSQPTVPEPNGIMPAALLDLSHWSLTLPVDSSGGTSGEAQIISTDQLLAGYSAQWFYGATDAANEGVAFWSPINGALTAHSSSSRSELREMLNPPDFASNWTWDTTSTLTAKLAVNQVPSADGKVIVGEILGYNGVDPTIGELAQLIFQYHGNSDRATLYALVLASPQASGSTATPMQITDSLRLNQVFSYTIHTESRVVSFSDGTHTVSAPIDPSWQNVGLFFRAGAHPRAAGPSSTDGARDLFYQLRASHP